MSQPDEPLQSAAVSGIWASQRRFAEGAKTDLRFRVPELALSPGGPAILSDHDVATIAAFLGDSNTDTVTKERVLAIVHGRAALPPVLLAEAARWRLARQCAEGEAHRLKPGALFQGPDAWHGLKPENFASPLLGLDGANGGESPRPALFLPANCRAPATLVWIACPGRSSTWGALASLVSRSGCIATSPPVYRHWMP